MATTYRFAHNRLIDGIPHLIWGNGIGDVLIPRGTITEAEALADRTWCDNDLADQGENDMLDVFFRNAANPATFYGRLYNDTPVNTDALSDLTGEQAGSGYAAVTWTANSTDFPTLALDTGDYKVTSLTRTYTATGTWTAVTYLVLATVASGTSGRHIAYSALSATRTLVNADTLDVSVAIKLA